MKKYKTTPYGQHAILETEIIRETEKCVYWSDPNLWRGKEQRCAKRSSYENYWDTWEEAHKYLMENAERNLESAKNSLSRAESRLKEVKNLKKETP